MRYLLTILLFISISVKGQVFGVLQGAPDTIVAIFNFSNPAESCAGCTNLDGDPSISLLSVTDPSGIGINTVATANWTQVGTCSCSAINAGGTQAGVFLPQCAGTVQALMYNSMFNDAPYNASAAQFELTGLIPSRPTTLQLTGSTVNGSAGSRLTGIILVGASTSSEMDYDPHPGVANTTGGVTFTGIMPNASGQIFVYFFMASTATQQPIIGGIRVKQ